MTRLALAALAGFILGLALRRERPCPDCQDPRHLDPRVTWQGADDEGDAIQPADPRPYSFIVRSTDPRSPITIIDTTPDPSRTYDTYSERN